MSKKKTLTVEDIINEYGKFHHKKGKSFQERIKKFEEFNNPENIHALQMAHHAHYTLFGRPGQEKDYPGAYNVAHKVLDQHAAEDSDVLKDENKLTEILEAYVDTFLQKVMGKQFNRIIRHAQEEDQLDQVHLRDLKGQLMGRYHRDKEGNPINILDKDNFFVKRLKGKKKIELIEELKGLSENIRESYTSHLQKEALEGLLSEDDRLDMAKYIFPAFEERGLKSPGAHITRSVREQASHYGALLQGATETLIKKAGYKLSKPKKEKKE